MTTSRYSEIPCLSGIGQFEIHFSWGMSVTVAFISFAHLGTAVAGRTTFQTRESNSASPPGTDLRNMVLCCNCKKASSHIQVVACGIAPPSLHTESGKILLSHVLFPYTQYAYFAELTLDYTTFGFPRPGSGCYKSQFFFNLTSRISL